MRPRKRSESRWTVIEDLLADAVISRDTEIERLRQEILRLHFTLRQTHANYCGDEPRWQGPKHMAAEAAWNEVTTPAPVIKSKPCTKCGYDVGNLPILHEVPDCAAHARDRRRDRRRRSRISRRRPTHSRTTWVRIKDHPTAVAERERQKELRALIARRVAEAGAAAAAGVSRLVLAIETVRRFENHAERDEACILRCWAEVAAAIAAYRKAKGSSS